MISRPGGKPPPLSDAGVYDKTRKDMLWLSGERCLGSRWGMALMLLAPFAYGALLAWVAGLV